MPERRDTRIELRATQADRALIVRAAEACNMKLSEFAVSHLVTDSRRILADRTEFVLSPEAQAEWETINARPARDLPSLRKLLERPSPFEQ
jgi:uncharacterized protein (DUF1778 family)